jgi:hypothetical protein
VFEKDLGEFDYLEVWHLGAGVDIWKTSRFGDRWSMTASRLYGVCYVLISTSSRPMAAVCGWRSP